MSDNIFSLIKAQVPIVDLIGQYVALKRAGLYWKARCPFHQEKTASFTVSPHIHIFHCFGCQESGDVISFFSKIEQCSQLEAAQRLAERFGIDIGHHAKESASKQGKTYYDICSFFATWSKEHFAKHSEVKDYMHNRGFLPKTIEQFAVGFMPGGLSSIKQLLEAARHHYILPDDLVHHGLLMQSKSVFYSPYEERIIFPITDHIGRICGFGGRTYRKNDERPKYYNSRDSDFFNKGSLLYGLAQAKKQIQETGSVFLVEGYTDCMAMAQHGFINTIATLGTACTMMHLKQIARYATRMVIIYDSDDAGHQAINRIAQLCWQVNIEPFVVELPARHDPASLLGIKEDLNRYIEQQEDIFLFFIKAQAKDFISLGLEKKLQIVSSIIQAISAVEDSIKQDILISKAAESLSIDVTLLKKELAKVEGNIKIQVVDQLNPPKKYDAYAIEKRIFVAIANNITLLDRPHVGLLISYLPSTLRTVLLKLKEWSILHGKQIMFAAFFDSLGDEDKQRVADLLFTYEESVDSVTFEILIEQLRKKWWKLITKQLKMAVLQAEREGDKQKVTQLLSDFITLQNQAGIKNTDCE
ncbi:MAG TPA: DNA primase [Patescibacteria group bacterium]|jgi:DNA primase|nr:DNA primase [Patescibacteria group bacterium]